MCQACVDLWWPLNKLQPDLLSPCCPLLPSVFKRVSAPIPSVPPTASPSHLSSSPHSFKTPDPRPRTRGCTGRSGLWTLFCCYVLLWCNLSHSSWSSPWEVGFPLGRHQGRPMLKALCWKGGCLQSNEDHKLIKYPLPLNRHPS